MLPCILEPDPTVTLHHFFLYSALLGAALFAVQWTLAAAAGDGSVGGGEAGDVADVGEPGHPSTDLAFKVLSVQGLSAFFTLFGLTGLALEAQGDLTNTVTLGGAFLAGWFTTFVLSRVFRAAHKLEGSGTLNLNNALGAEATVYLRIAPNKPGKVTVAVQGRLVEAEAITERDTLETGERVLVLRVLPEGSLLVARSKP